jgi:predicted  nucleic acid-binding Zn-ribbon protein
MTSYYALMQDLPSGAFEPRRYKPGNIGNWSGHLSFGRDLVLAIAPDLLVELGTHFGESYFGFCQAIAESGKKCHAYAVDTWMGEPHTGFYSEEIYEEVTQYNEANYGNFSYLLKSQFDEALEQFAEETIDILHIDGLHTFEAVSHDFYSWLPKVKPGGIVLLHDIAARHSDFGVWRLWDRLKSEGATFEFHHSWGLGVFEKRGATKSRNAFLDVLLSGDPVVQDHLRRYYFLSAVELECKHRLAAPRLTAQQGNTRHLIQVFRPSADGYKEEQSHTAEIDTNGWQWREIKLIEGLRGGALRIDVASCPAIIDIRGIDLRSVVGEQILWAAADQDIAALQPGGTLIGLGETENGAYRFFSYGTDPQLYLPELNSEVFDQPLTLGMWVRLQTELDALLPVVKKGIDERTQNGSTLNVPHLEAPDLEQALESARLRQEAEAEQTRLKSELESLHSERKLEVERLEQARDAALYECNHLRSRLEAAQNAITAERQALKSERDSADQERDLYKQQLVETKQQLVETEAERDRLIDETNKRQTMLYLLKDSHQELKRVQEALTESERRYTAAQQNYEQLSDSHRQLTEEHEGLQKTFSDVLNSQSWRLTEPLRAVVRRLRFFSSRTHE